MKKTQAEETRIEEATEKALQSFWESVSESFSEIEEGDFDPMLEGLMSSNASEWVSHWVEINSPKKEMKSFEVQFQFNSWAYITLEAESADHAREIARNLERHEWKQDYDWENMSELEIFELEEDGSRKD
jgi:cell fate regulator YaaT (PSP1 superfamily)